MVARWCLCTDAYPHSNANTDSDTYADSNPNAYPDTDSYSYADTNLHRRWLECNAGVHRWSESVVSGRDLRSAVVDARR